MALTKLNARSASALDATILTGNLPAISGASLTGVGITVAEVWRLTSNATGDVTAITNVEKADTDGAGEINAGMAESSGIWTFPSTGIWLVRFTGVSQLDGDARLISLRIMATTNNSSYSEASESYYFIQQTSSTATWNTGTCEHMFDVTNTSNDKIKFAVDTINTSSILVNSTANNLTHFVFQRLGDT